jgi:hypothetical protein
VMAAFVSKIFADMHNILGTMKIHAMRLFGDTIKLTLKDAQFSAFFMNLLERTQTKPVGAPAAPPANDVTAPASSSYMVDSVENLIARTCGAPPDPTPSASTEASMKLRADLKGADVAAEHRLLSVAKQVVLSHLSQVEKLTGAIEAASSTMTRDKAPLCLRQKPATYSVHGTRQQSDCR